MADSESPPVASPRSRLRIRFAGAATLGALGLAALWRTFGTAWVLAAAAPGAYQAAYAWTNLSANRRPGDDRPEPRLGPANAITLFRGWLASVLAGALAAAPPHPWIPVALFAGAVGLDAVDGAVARRTRETVLGARLDGATDALAVLVGAAVAVALGAVARQQPVVVPPRHGDPIDRVVVDRQVARGHADRGVAPLVAEDPNALAVRAVRGFEAQHVGSGRVGVEVDDGVVRPTRLAGLEHVAVALGGRVAERPVVAAARVRVAGR